MIWQKEKGIENRQNLDYMILAMIVFFLIAIIFNQALLFAVIGMMLGYLTLVKIYDHHIGQKLHLKNERTSIRLFPGDEATLTFELHNKSIIPYVNGDFTFQTDKNMRIIYDQVHLHKREQSVRIPLSVLGKKKGTITLPIMALERGTIKIKNIQYTFPNLFSFVSTTLRYVPYYHTEYVIFPDLLEVQGLRQYFQQKSGDQRVLVSPYEDTLSPYGTRDYHFSDPFHKISWKASAKLQTLQTTVFDRVLSQSLLIIVNIGSQHGANMTHIHPDMEKLLSYTAYICRYASETDIPYEIMMNVRKPGRTPYIHMPEGTGKNHYVRILEMLARIPHQPLVIPINHLLYQVMQTLSEPKTVIVIGEISPMIQELIDQLQHVQPHILHVERTTEGAMLRQWTKAVTTYGT